MVKTKVPYVVETYFGNEETWAVSDRQAVSNVAHRLRLRGVSDFSLHPEHWKVRRLDAECVNV